MLSGKPSFVANIHTDNQQNSAGLASCQGKWDDFCPVEKNWYLSHCLNTDGNNFFDCWRIALHGEADKKHESNYNVLQLDSKEYYPEIKRLLQKSFRHSVPDVVSSQLLKISNEQQFGKYRRHMIPSLLNKQQLFELLSLYWKTGGVQFEVDVLSSNTIIQNVTQRIREFVKTVYNMDIHFERGLIRNTPSDGMILHHDQSYQLSVEDQYTRYAKMQGEAEIWQQSKHPPLRLPLHHCPFRSWSLSIQLSNPNLYTRWRIAFSDTNGYNSSVQLQPGDGVLFYARGNENGQAHR